MSTPASRNGQKMVASPPDQHQRPAELNDDLWSLLRLFSVLVAIAANAERQHTEAAKTSTTVAVSTRREIRD